MIANVYEFHRKFALPLGTRNLLLPHTDEADALTSFRAKFMQEELDEFKDAIDLNYEIKAFDALLDLAYVVYGTALFMGIKPEQWYAGMRAVHNANMAKVRATSKDQSKRGNTFDVVKPSGWVGPEQQLAEILSWTR